MQADVTYQESCQKDYKYFKSIPKNQRSTWNTKMLQTPQQKGQWKVFKTPYPNSAKWQYHGHKLHYGYGKTQQKAKAIIFYFHGLNAHGQSSGYMIMDLVSNLPVDGYCLDFMNFGRSEGQFRGQIKSMDSLIDQAEKFIEFVKGQYNNAKELKIFISGLSLGGAICFNLCLRNPQAYDGVIFLSPALRQNKQAQPYLKKIGRFFGTYFPRTKIVSQTFNSQSRVDQTERIMADEYIYKDKVVPGSIKVVLEAMNQIQTEYSKFKNPFILFQSGVDKMVDPFLALDFEEQSQSKDKTVMYYRNMWHAVFGEEQIQHIVTVIRKWMNERIK